MSNNKQSINHIPDVGKKVSSVEWLFEKLRRYNEELVFLYQNEIEQAKAMRKQEMKEAWDNSAIDATYGNKFKNFEQYYKETYGGNK